MLQYITTNFNNLILVNKFYSQVIFNSDNFKLDCKYNLSISVFVFISCGRTAITENEEINYYVNLIKDKEFIDRFFDIKYDKYKLEQNIPFSKIALKHSQTLRMRINKYEINNNKGIYKNEPFDRNWFHEKMKLNEDIEIHDMDFTIYTLEKMKYCIEHVRLFIYNDLCDKIYLDSRKHHIIRASRFLRCSLKFRKYIKTLDN